MVMNPQGCGIRDLENPITKQCGNRIVIRQKLCRRMLVRRLFSVSRPFRSGSCGYITMRYA